MKHFLLIFLFVGHYAVAHDFHSTNNKEAFGLESEETTQTSSGARVRYLGNEALLITNKQTKVLFDPFFHNDYRTYQLVPNNIRESIFAGKKPYNNVSAIFISHAHEDHFSVKDIVNYLRSFSSVKLFASKQAISQIDDYGKANQIAVDSSQLNSVALNYGDAAWQTKVGNLTIGAVRIPHAGWPGRANIENLVFSVTLDEGVTIMHMGDADPDDQHYLPFKEYWQKQTIDINFPPYWFLYSAEGNDILKDIIGAKRNIGVHVPVNVPNQLKNTNAEYFSVPGEEVSIKR